MDEAIAILALGMINSHHELQNEFKTQAIQSPTAGADFLRPYLRAALMP
jgi:hypothetical protein